MQKDKGVPRNPTPVQDQRATLDGIRSDELFLEEVLQRSATFNNDKSSESMKEVQRLTLQNDDYLAQLKATQKQVIELQMTNILQQRKINLADGLLAKLGHPTWTLGMIHDVSTGVMEKIAQQVVACAEAGTLSTEGSARRSVRRLTVAPSRGFKMNAVLDSQITQQSTFSKPVSYSADLNDLAWRYPEISLNPPKPDAYVNKTFTFKRSPEGTPAVPEHVTPSLQRHIHEETTSQSTSQKSGCAVNTSFRMEDRPSGSTKNTVIESLPEAKTVIGDTDRPTINMSARNLRFDLMSDHADEELQQYEESPYNFTSLTPTPQLDAHEIPMTPNISVRNRKTVVNQTTQVQNSSALGEADDSWRSPTKRLVPSIQHADSDVPLDFIELENRQKALFVNDSNATDPDMHTVSLSEPERELDMPILDARQGVTKHTTPALQVKSRLKSVVGRATRSASSTGPYNSRKGPTLTPSITKSNKRRHATEDDSPGLNSHRVKIVDLVNDKDRTVVVMNVRPKEGHVSVYGRQGI